MESEEKVNENFSSLREECEEDEDEVEETAKGLMTDMTLEDDIDKIRDSEPGSWTYHIEAYPWNADDINVHFIRLMKLATFSNVSMRKKPVSHETEATERIVDKVMERQRKGSLHLYAESYQTAKSIIRHSTWKSMTSKELTFEITKRCPDTGQLVKARIDLDTYSMCKVRFRDKIKGSFKARSAKISNLPSTITREFLDVVFARSYAAYDGTETESHWDKKDTNMQQTLGEITDFNGSLDMDCLSRGSCRAFVLAHKSVFILGQELSILANDSQTMVVPPEVQSVALKKTEDKTTTTTKTTTKASAIFSRQVTPARGWGARDNTLGRASSLSRINSPAAHMVQGSRMYPMTSAGRARGIGGIRDRGMMSVQQQATPLISRPGPGMPVPKTGRQKMNEKMRRNHPNNMTGIPNTGVHPAMGVSAGSRASSVNSIGDCFKLEIASLQSELERSTQAIEAKIERLKEESIYYNDYNEEMNMYVEGEWDDGGYEDYEVSQEEYYGEEGSNYFDQGYDLQSFDTSEYEVHYEASTQPMMPASRGMPRSRASRGRGLLQATGQRTDGFMDNTGVRLPVHIRRRRGRGSGLVYQDHGTSTSGYW